MRSKTLARLTLLALLLAVVACGGAETPSPATSPTEPAPEPSVLALPTPSAQPTVEPTATVQQETIGEAGEAGQTEVVWVEAPCPMDLPPGAIEGTHITCGYVTVPEARAAASGGEPSGRTIQLAVAVIHSDSDDPAPDPLVMLAGGPGQSALDSFVQLLAVPGMEGFRAVREILLVEQRGTQYSTPFLRCEEMAELKLDLLEENPGDEDEEARKLAAWAACRERFVESGVDLATYNSLEIAADVIAVADALGYDHLNLYGGSYGSLLAQHIMRDYPERVRSAILDAVSPLRHEPNLLYKAHATDRALRLVFSRCQEDAACNETYPDLEEVYFGLVDQLNAEPATVQIRKPESGEAFEMLLTGDRLIAQTRELLYVTAILPDLPGAIYDMAEGDFSLLALIQSQFLFNLNLADGLYNSVVCSELADFTRADMAEPEGLYPEVAAVVEDLIDEVMLQPCQVWGVEHLGGRVTDPAAGDIPTLLMAGEFDPTVPPQLSEVAAEKLTHAYLYTFPGIGHSLLGSSPCAHAMMLAFLDEPGEAPDATCLDEMPGLVFRLPVGELVLEPFTDEGRGFRGVVPAGWQARAPANLVRASSATDPAYFVLEAQPGTAADLFGILAGQLALDPGLEPALSMETDSLAWDLYAFEVQGLPADLALAEDGEKAYFVFLISPADEHEILYEQLFLPAVEAMVPL